MIEHSHQILYTIYDVLGATWSGIDSVSKCQGHTAQSVLVSTVSSLHLIWTFTRWCNRLPLTMHPDSIRR